MREILGWLITYEDRAARLYKDASIALAHDPEFASFLSRLARDEEGHHKSMVKAGELIGPDAKVWTAVTLDAATRDSIERQFDGIEKLISSSGLMPEAMAVFLAETECSEWNDLYLFVLNTVIHDHKEFVPSAVEIQRHKRRIERFLKERGYGSEQVERLQKLKALWNERLLVVDDEPAIADVLSAILEDEGKVDCAANGAEALEMLGRKYYAAIISDIDMPVMDGMAFYDKALALYPGIGRRFLFHTGLMDEKREAFFSRHKAAYLQKPADIRTIRNAISAILEG